MFYSNEQLKNAVNVFRENSYWRSYYDDAPSDKCREYIAFDFACSIYLKKEINNEYWEQNNKLENELDYDDWKWLYKHSGNNPTRKKYKKKMEEMSED